MARVQIERRQGERHFRTRILTDKRTCQGQTMHKTMATLGVLALLSFGATAQAAVINLDGFGNSGPDDSNAVAVLLGPGTYALAPVIGAYTAFNPFGNVTGCDDAGANCETGWNWRFAASADQPVVLKPGFGFPQLGQYFATAELAFANAPSLGQFTLTAPTTLKFWVPDGVFVRDNLGGASFSLTAVPEPSTWALAILGFGMAGAALRRRSALGAWPGVQN